MQQLEFVLGETRYARILISSTNNEAFVIRDASYELLEQSGHAEATGDCVIDGHIIMSLISPLHTGRYKLKISYHIADEDLIEVVEVVV